MSILSIEDIEEEIHEAIYRGITKHEYDRAFDFLRRQLDVLVGHDDPMTIWFTRLRVSDGTYILNEHESGFTLTLQNIFETNPKIGPVWSENDIDILMSRLMTTIQKEYDECTQFLPRNEDIEFKLYGRQKIIKAKTRESDFMFEPPWHFEADWWGPHET